MKSLIIEHVPRGTPLITKGLPYSFPLKKAKKMMLQPLLIVVWAYLQRRN